MDYLIAIRRNRPLAEVRLEKHSKAVLSKKFEELGRSFLNADTEVHQYAPAFHPEDGSVLELEYQLPPDLGACRQSLPNGIHPIDGKVVNEGIAALVAIEAGSQPRFYFQAVDPRTMLRPENAVFFNPHGFVLNEKAGLILPNRIDALHDGANLYFRSEIVVRRFLDMDKFFIPATDAEIKEIFGTKAFIVNDWNALKGAANTPLRRKLHGVLSSGRTLSASAIQTVAARIKTKLQLQTKNGAIVVPTAPKDFREFVRIIDDAYLESILDHKSVYLTTSKKRM